MKVIKTKRKILNDNDEEDGSTRYVLDKLLILYTNGTKCTNSLANKKNDLKLC
jgi:hypothetical protein